MKLIFRTPKIRQPVTLEVSPDAKLEDVRNELQSKHNFEQGDYKFVCDKRALQNPTPFSSLKENSTIIVFIKPQSASSQSPSTKPIQSDLQKQLPKSSPEAIQIISPILNSAISINLVENAYKPENNFLNHPKDVYEISQKMDEASRSLFCEFIKRHFQITLDSFELSPDLIMSMIGHGLPEVHHVISEFNKEFMQLASASKNEVSTILEKFDKIEPKEVLDTFIGCNCDKKKTESALNQKLKKEE